MASTRGVAYTATVIDLEGGPVIAPDPRAPLAMSIEGFPLPTPWATRAILPYGLRLAVMLHTTPAGPGWRILHGPHAGALVPYHHPSWSVNPVPVRL